jgi:chromatin remodeling complex protein RSC6
MAPRKSSKASSSATAPVVDVVEDVVVSPPEVVETVVDTASVEVVEDVPVDKFELVLAILNKTLTETKEAITLVKTLQKEDKKASKKVSKRSKKDKSDETKASRPASGFAKPTKLSDTLCTFLGVPSGTEMSRTDVTRVLNQYIKTNSLQDTNDKRTIIPDAKLKSILDTTEGTLTYFTLQKHIKHHFVKA